MIPTRRVVTLTKKKATNQLPEFLTERAILVESLEAQGYIRQIADRLRVRREGGYHGVDIVVFLILLFAARLRVSIMDFGEMTHAHRPSARRLGPLVAAKPAARTISQAATPCGHRRGSRRPCAARGSSFVLAE